MTNIAVILFPGSNCELEALRACKRVDMNTKLVRWNDSESDLSSFDGFILPGGFSYEDRGRSGIIASKDPIFEKILKEADKGKPLIGICNGAQMLVELGVIPGITVQKLDMALAWNERIRDGKILGTGFYNDWITIKNDVTPGRCAFNNFSKNVVLRIPVAHGEGRFTTQIPELLDEMIAREQTVFRYSDSLGNCTDGFPTNPNNAIYNLAGICNSDGNIMALMPHPERTPVGDPIFTSMKEYIEQKKYTKIDAQKATTAWAEKPLMNFTANADYTLRIKLIITDNEERTLEQAFHRIGFDDLNLSKWIYVGITLTEKPQTPEAEKMLLETVIRSNEIMNPNKEMVKITTQDGRKLIYDTAKGIVTDTEETVAENGVIVIDPDNYSGKSMAQSLQKRYPQLQIKNIAEGTLWNIKSSKPLPEIIDAHLLHNPHSAEIYSLN